MTSRLHFFPRLDVREAPRRESTAAGSWAVEWAQALARARAVNAIPSAYAMPNRTPRTAEVKAAANEQRRKAQRFIEEEISQ
jgi:hypothetical protein